MTTFAKYSISLDAGGMLELQNQGTVTMGSTQYVYVDPTNNYRQFIFDVNGNVLKDRWTGEIVDKGNLQRTQTDAYGATNLIYKAPVASTLQTSTLTYLPPPTSPLQSWTYDSFGNIIQGAPPPPPNLGQTGTTTTEQLINLYLETAAQTQREGEANVQTWSQYPALKTLATTPIPDPITASILSQNIESMESMDSMESSKEEKKEWTIGQKVLVGGGLAALVFIFFF